MEGRILGNRYELLEKIGGGGMALVYKAKCRLLNRFVAIKILRSEFTNDEEFVKRFRVEAQAAASLTHPNIVSIYDVGYEDGIHYIVMEYVNGVTLKDYINSKGALPWNEAIDIAIQVCSAIEVAHLNNIVHRDIKPHNILLTKDGVAKVTDFGIARAVTSSTITMAGSTIGSVHYFSPEQARGGYTDEKSDLYSLGITLYEMVTGQLPFDGETPVSIALKHIQVDPRQPAEINSSIPKSLNDIILKSIKKEKEKRYQSARDMLDDLNKSLKDPDGDFVIEESVDSHPTRVMQAIKDDISVEKDEVSMANSKSKKSNKVYKNKTVWLAVAASVTILLLFGIIAYMLILKPLSTPVSDFVVKDYTGLNYNEVKDELLKSDIKTKEDRKHSDKYAKDQIISQDIPKGQTLKSGGYSPITFVVSDGPDIKKIPQLKGYDIREAESKLQDELGLTVINVDEYSDTISVNKVVRTVPEANQEVKAGSEVTVYVSIGPEVRKTIVPELTGKYFSEAKDALTKAKLTVGTLTPQGGSSTKIASQEPLAGTEVKEDTPVNIVFEQVQQVQTTPKPQAKTDTLYVSLTNNGSGYGDKISVLIKVKPSDTKKTIAIMDEEKNKGDFPLRIPITIPANGYTEVFVELDGKTYIQQTFR